MAKTTAPLLSFSGKGQIGKTQVYSKWRGVSYARRYVVPANPNSTEQQKTRGVFSWLSEVFKLLNASAQAPWKAYASGKPLTDRNAFAKFNVAGLRGTTSAPVTTLANMIASPGAGGGLPVTSMTTSDATGHVIGVSIDAPDVPAGWAAVKAHAFAIKQQDAKTDQFYTSVYGEDAASTGTISLSMGAAGTYAVFGWIDYTKPDGSVAYGPSTYKQQIIV